MTHIQTIIKKTAVVLLIQTIIWVIFTGFSMSQIQPSWTPADLIGWAAYPDIFFYGNYINVFLLTIGILIMFSFLYNLLKTNYPNQALIGFVFIPIYGVLNLICYATQISLVPLIARNSISNPDFIYFSSLVIQANPQSIIAFINGLAYAILGIPSIIYGLLLIKETKKYSGILLSLNGFFCIIGIIGCIIQNRVMSMGIMIGGIVFLLALAVMIIEFKQKK
jgi:hypothetical protein